MSTKQAAVEYFAEHAEQYTAGHYRAAPSSSMWRRHRAILEVIRAQESTSRSRILELGCGPGLLACDLAQLGYAGVGVDAAPTMIAMSRANYAASKLDALWSFQLADVEDLPLT